MLEKGADILTKEVVQVNKGRESSSSDGLRAATPRYVFTLYWCGCSLSHTTVPTPDLICLADLAHDGIYAESSVFERGH